MTSTLESKTKAPRLSSEKKDLLITLIFSHHEVKYISDVIWCSKSMVSKYRKKFNIL